MDLETIINSSKSLSPAPQILPKLQKLLRDPNSDIEDIVSLIKMDAPLSAQVVRMSNSSFYGGSIPCENISEAVHRLGFREVFRVVGVAASRQVLGKETVAYRLNAGEMFERSLACAFFMEELCRKTGLDHESGYTMGLLHPLGKVVLNDYFLQRGIELYSADQTPMDEESLPALEKQALGFDNAQVASALLKKWGFPEDVCVPIRHQFDPMSAPTSRNRACLLFISRRQSLVLRDVKGALKTPIAPEVYTEARITQEFVEECQAGVKEKLANAANVVSGKNEKRF